MTEKERVEGPSRDEKRSRFQAKDGKPAKPKRWMVYGAIGVVVVTAAAFGVLLMLEGGGADRAPLSAASSTSTTSTTYSAATRGHAAYPLVEADASGTVRFVLATFDDYAAHYYTYIHDDQSVEFFILKSEDGVVRAAFNACDVCYGALKGYSQDGQIMICNNCGRRFPADGINIVQGGCNPSPLDRTIDGDYLVIRANDIADGAIYF